MEKEKGKREGERKESRHLAVGKTLHKMAEHLNTSNGWST